jgi:putative membrane protein
MGWMGLWWILGLAALVALVWVVVRISSGTPREESPEGILRRRYARGEIDREEYQRQLEDLRK